jgi:hypothetical protein
MVFKRGGDEARAMRATLNLGKLVKFEKVIATQQSEPSVGASEADPNGGSDRRHDRAFCRRLYRFQRQEVRA